MGKSTNHEKKVTWWQMSFIGVGCIIGTGYFLGSSITIEKAGYLVLFAYFLAAIGTWIVYDSLAKLTAHHPEKGSFRTYAKQAFGPWAGFSNGWVYWSSEMLIMGSQLTALALFAQFWFPKVPLWLTASVFASLGLIVILIGVQLVEKMENAFGIMKIAAIIMFLAIGAAALLGWLEPEKGQVDMHITSKHFLSGSTMGLWVALVYAFYAFGGIEVMGLMANELEDPKNAPKAGKIMLFVLTILYVMSFFVVLKLTPIKSIDPNESPFLTALTQFDFPWVPHVFNAILIIAGFSTMVASLYAVTTMLVTLAEEEDAPAFFAKKSRKIPLPAFGLTTLVVLLSIVVALLLPENIFEYLTTAAGLMLLYNWMFILFSYRKLTKMRFKAHIKIGIGVLLIATAISGTLFDRMSRAGFFVSLCFLLLIAGATFIKWKRKRS